MVFFFWLITRQILEELTGSNGQHHIAHHHTFCLEKQGISRNFRIPPPPTTTHPNFAIHGHANFVIFEKEFSLFLDKNRLTIQKKNSTAAHLLPP